MRMRAAADHVEAEKVIGIAMRTINATRDIVVLVVPSILILIAQLLEVIVVDSEKVSDFVDNSRFHFLFDFIHGVALILYCPLKNEDPVGIQRLLKKTAFGDGHALVQT